MIKGLGIDIIEINRIKEAVEKYGDSFLNKIYTQDEINYCKKSKAYRFPELAVRFAAKEAYSKAMGVGISGFGRNNDGINWKDVEVVNNDQGKPFISVDGKIIEKSHVSLSHSKDYAVAEVIIEE